jgi:hypothetical protein
MFSNCSKLKIIKMNGGLNENVNVTDILYNAGKDADLGTDENRTFYYSNGDYSKITSNTTFSTFKWTAVDLTVKTADE